MTSDACHDVTVSTLLTQEILRIKILLISKMF